HSSWQLAWPLAACSMYGLVYVERRYLAAFLVLFWLAIYGALMFRLNKWATMPVLAIVLCTVMIPFTEQLLAWSAWSVRDLGHATRPDYETFAVILRNLGLRSGDRLAAVGYCNDSYYAHFARLRVVAQIPNEDQFWRLSAPELNR